MKKLYVVLAVAAVALMLTTPALAMGGMDCNMGTTIQALHDCVVHARDMGHIDNAGVANSLLAKIDAAQAAYDRGQSSVAINNLQAFVQQVQAQSGKHITQEHADHMGMHAQMVIDALSAH
jgi:hypothetical protein